MPIRHPPENRVPPVVRDGKRRQRPPRIIKYEEPPATKLQRLKQLLLRPYVVIPLACLAVIVICFLVYYWIVLSRRIDNLLSGEVFTRSAGIYAAPKQIRAGQNLSEDELVAYLKRAGYVEQGQQGESARGRYVVNGINLDVVPGGGLLAVTDGDVLDLELIRGRLAHRDVDLWLLVRGHRGTR